MELIDFTGPAEFDFSEYVPQHGWLEKYAFVFPTYDKKGRKTYSFCFAHQYSGRIFNGKTYCIGHANTNYSIRLDHRFKEYALSVVKEFVPLKDGIYEVPGLWCMGVGRDDKKGQMYWDDIVPGPMKQMKRLVALQDEMIKRELLTKKRPHYGDNYENMGYGK